MIALLLAGVLAAGAFADSPVWRVERDGSTLYLGGTIHLLGPDDYPLPEVFDEAYERASHIVFETYIRAVQSPQLQQRMAQAMLYQDGRTLQGVLSPPTFDRLSEFLAGRGMPVEPFLPFRAGAISLTLSVMELQRLGIAGSGVDEFYTMNAVQDGKRLGQLETVDEQLAFLRDFGEGDEDAIVLSTLNDLVRLDDIMAGMKAAWRSGDLAALDAGMLAPMREQFPAVYRSLIVDRNEAWLDDIAVMIASDEVEFVLVGAAHLVGRDGLVARLREQGYRVTAL
jgi:hypothetical protein